MKRLVEVHELQREVRRRKEAEAKAKQQEEEAARLAAQKRWYKIW
jgi:hypothetical protein